LATYGTRAKRGTWNSFQWHAEWTEIQYMILCIQKPVWSWKWPNTHLILNN
jgi:hypothetical protein